jgi:predicted nucleotidyltransferase
MIRPETIDRAIDIIIAQCEPEQIFVIGSYASGTAKRTSDLDLLIIQASTESKRQRDERVELLLAPLLIPVDVNVYTPDEFEEECRQPFGFVRTVIELQGKLVYSRAPADVASASDYRRPRSST